MNKYTLKTPVHRGGALASAPSKSAPLSKAAIRSLTLAVLLGIAGGLGAPGLAAAETELTSSAMLEQYAYYGSLGKATTTDFDGYYLGTTFGDDTLKLRLIDPDDTINSYLAAGYRVNDEVSNYKLIVESGKFNGWLFGGYAANAQANNNKLTISGGTLSAPVNGGQGKTGANENEVTISGGTLTGMVHGGWAESGPASDNQVTVEGGTLSGRIYGGRTDSGNANNNTVTIKGGVLNHTADYIILGGWTDNGNANNNIVTISGGTVSGSKDIYGGRGGSGEANNNTVTISGTANFTGQPSVYGGYLDGSSGTASNNTVNLLTKVTLKNLVGGEVSIGVSTDNTLNVAAKDITVNSLRGFQHLNFYLPEDIAKNDVMLTVNYGADLTNATVGVAALRGVNLEVNDTVTLLTAGTLSGVANRELTNTIAGSLR